MMYRAIAFCERENESNSSRNSSLNRRGFDSSTRPQCDG